MGISDTDGFVDDIADGGDFLVLTFTKSKTSYPGISASTPVRVKAREHWFFKVEASRRITYRPYNGAQAVAAYHQQDEQSQRPYLNPDEGTPPVPLIDQSGEEILRNDDDQWFVYHVGVSPLQGDIRVYPQVPDSQPGGVFQYLGSNRPAGPAGDPIGYISGDDHPSFYDPQTGISTTLAWDTGVNTDIRYQFYNENKTRRRIPLLNIFGAGYVLTPVTDSSVQRNILNEAHTGSDNITHVEWGPIRETFSYDVPDQWDTAGNYLEEVEPTIPDEYRDSGISGDVEDQDVQELTEQVAASSEFADGENNEALKELVRRASNDG